jgi:hypothetical protein
VNFKDIVISIRLETIETWRFKIAFALLGTQPHTPFTSSPLCWGEFMRLAAFLMIHEVSSLIPFLICFEENWGCGMNADIRMKNRNISSIHFCNDDGYPGTVVF